MPLSYTEKAKNSVHPLAQRLFELIQRKQTNLCVSADLTCAQDVLALADLVGPHICVLKTHVDILSDFFYDSFALELQNIAKKHDFLIFEDRKFADIGNTVKLQHQGGIYRISSWAEIVNCHILPGEGIIQGLSLGQPDRGLLILAEMSSKGNLLTGDYTKKAYEMAAKYSNEVIGFIGQQRHSFPGINTDSMIVMTPGVNLEASQDALGQQYRTPRQVFESGCDVIIVGRGICGLFGKNDLLVRKAKEYQQAGWSAYQEYISSHQEV